MDLLAALAATWPAAETVNRDGWLLRRGEGGGNRVSAARRVAAGAEIAVAEAAMRGWGQRPLFMIGPGEDALDAALAARGYALRDPTAILVAPAACLSVEATGDAVIFCEHALACMAAIWAAGGIGPARLAVMARAPAPRVWLLGRDRNRPAGCAFVAIHGRVAMLHALEIDPEARRRGLGGRMSRAAALWAAREGAEVLALAVTRANAAALALYGGLGMTEAAGYHYRAAEEEARP